ncbi:DNA-binding protein [Cellulomonas hominis]|uniref:DNA-binding protein n=1 Tax=Cellulomonas hominis TaxID=156981 RepID=UPI0014445CA0|nr:DNA-binding protein [Cellulomonas hominis]NKY08925.1 DNA-binding protein [Cellulomonas hominis]
MARILAAELAERLGHSADYWLRKARRREIPHRKVGRSIWWEEEDVQRILSDALVEPVERVNASGLTPGSLAAHRRRQRRGD